jgi:hypothetical protein
MALTKIPGNLIETGAITGDVLADGGIATAKLANDAVTTDKILDANITHAKLHATMDLTGKTVTVATAAGSTNTTAAASTAFVQQELTTLIGGAPGTLDTLNELAAAINDDSNYNSTLTTALATKLPLAGGTLTGTLNAVAANFSSDVRISGWLTGASATNTLFSGNSTGTIIQTPSNTNDAAGSFYIRDSLGAVHFTLNTNTNVSTFAGTIDSGAITSSGVVTATGTDTQQYRLLQGTAIAGGMFKERTITGAGVSNDVSIFAESINDGGEIHFMTGGLATKRVTIDSSGFVGIGTEDPYGRLELKGGGNLWTTAPAIRMWDDTNSKGWFVGTANNITPGDFYIRTLPSISGTPGATEQEFTIKHGTGNVGIGTTSPAYALEVNGQVKSAEGLHSNNWQLYNTGTNGFLIGTNISVTDYAHIHGEIKLQQFNYNTQQIINFSATVAATGVHTSAASSDIPVTIKLFKYAGTWYIWVPSPSNYSDISAYIHMGAGYQGTSRSSNAITSLSASGVPSSGVTNSVDIIAKIAVPGSVIQTVYAQNGSLVTPSQTPSDYITLIQVNITPKYATSKILINGIAAVSFSGGNYPAIHARIYRDSTLAKQYQYWGYQGPTNTHRILNEPVHYLDSPTTTSALTYYVKIANTSGSSYTGTYTAIGNSYNQSTITVQEIAQ